MSSFAGLSRGIVAVFQGFAPSGWLKTRWTKPLPRTFSQFEVR